MASNHIATRYSRRELLSTSVSTGLLLGASGVASAAGPDTIEVPIAKQRDEAILTREVPQDWWDHVLAGRAARDELQRRLGAERARKRVGLKRGSESIHGRRRWELTVEVPGSRGEGSSPESGGSPADTSRPSPIRPSEVPAEVRGFDVNVEEGETRQVSCINNHGFDPVPGGVVVRPHPFSGTGAGTFCCRVDKTGTESGYYMLTADHNISDGDTAYQYQTLFGTGTNYRSPDANLDYNLVDRTNDDIGMDSTVDYGGASYELAGRATNLEAIDEPIRKTGITTGYTTGTVNWVLGDFFRTYNAAAKGDSGGPMFFTIENNYGPYAIMVGMTTKQKGESLPDTSCGDTNFVTTAETFGPTAEAIHDDASVSFT